MKMRSVVVGEWARERRVWAMCGGLVDVIMVGGGEGFDDVVGRLDVGVGVGVGVGVCGWNQNPRGLYFSSRWGLHDGSMVERLRYNVSHDNLEISTVVRLMVHP